MAADDEDQARRCVRLRREFKSLSVADLLADRGLDEELPGRALSALSALERGDLAAAEAALPGSFGRLVPGPFAQRRRGRLVRWIVLSLLAAAAVGATIVALELP